jgi:hypothetical protein
MILRVRMARTSHDLHDGSCPTIADADASRHMMSPIVDPATRQETVIGAIPSGHAGFSARCFVGLLLAALLISIVGELNG